MRDMAFCSQCGKDSEKDDAFCRTCGSKLSKASVAEGDILVASTELRALVDRAAESIKKELLGQISQIEDDFFSGKIDKKFFESEAAEIKGRLTGFIRKKT
jgi:hypothetical protein